LQYYTKILSYINPTYLSGNAVLKTVITVMTVRVQFSPTSR